MKYLKNNNYGFTLFELVIVITILGLLIGIFYPKVQNREKFARVQSTANIVHQIFDAAEKWRLANEKMNYDGISIDDLERLNLWNKKIKHAFMDIDATDTYSITSINNHRGLSIIIKYVPISDVEIQNMFKDLLESRNFKMNTASSSNDILVVEINGTPRT